MRRALPLLALALLIVPAATAEVTDERIRVGHGSIPEQAGGGSPTDWFGPEWNLEYAALVDAPGSVSVALPAGATYSDVRCDCTTDVATSQGNVTVTFSDVSASTQLFVLLQAPGVDDVFSMDLGNAGGEEVVVYVPRDLPLHAAVEATTKLTSANDPTRDFYQFVDAPGSLWFSLTPTAAGTGVTTETVTVTQGDAAPVAPGFDFLALAIGIVGGALVWAFLVSRGAVQKRQRRQVAGTAAHVEARKESLEALAGRKRVLLAALKELEMAKMHKEIDTDVYDALKADYKKQAVTVMRALEAAE